MSSGIGPLAGRRVFVTGATGLVGSWLVRRLLEDGAMPIVLARDLDPQSELVRSGSYARCTSVSGRLEELRDLERALVDHEADTVFHLGAQALVEAALEDPFATLEANVRGTYQLLEACRRHPKRLRAIVIASSDKAYGTSPTLPYVEDMPLSGRHPYDVSKSCGDLLSVCYAETYRLPVGIARCGNVFGGGDLNWSRLVPGTIRTVLEGGRPIVRSNGLYTRDYVYAEDVVDAYLSLAEGVAAGHAAGRAFNFGPARPLSVLDVVSRILAALGRTDLTPIIENRAQAEILDQYLDSARARTELGWAPKYTFDEALTPTIAWYRTFLGYPA